MSQTIHRFVALDVHKSYVVVGALDTRQEVVLHPRRVSLLQLDGWAKKHLKPTDAIVLEATSNAWYIHDLLEPLVARVVVANPYLVKLIAASFVKTDKRDTLVLAGVAPFRWTGKGLHDSASISMDHLVSERRCIAEG